MLNKSIIPVIILILSIIIFNIHSIFFVGIALLFVLLFFIFYKSSVGIAKEIWLFLLFISVSNLLDEIFFNPTRVGVNEIFFGIVMFCTFVYKVFIKKVWKTPQPKS